MLNNAVDRIYKAYIELQLSRSPFALTKKADFENGVYLAHVLKSIDLEKTCLECLDNLLILDGKINQRKIDLVKKFFVADSNIEKINLLKTELEHITSIQNKNSYLTHETQTRNRSTSLSCTTHPTMTQISKLIT